MDELLATLRSGYAAPIPDGRMIDFRLDGVGGKTTLVATVSGYGRPKMIATVGKALFGYQVNDCHGSEVLCLTPAEVAEEVQRLALYSNGCWNCKRPVVLTAQNRCTKCNKFVRCSCGNCLCEKVSIQRALTPEEVDEVANRLTAKWGHLFAGREEQV